MLNIEIFIPLVIVIVAYAFGLLSTARVFAKTFRYLKLSKIGTGHLDTRNIYSNVSKPMGFIVGLIDIAKSYAFLYLLRYLLVDVFDLPAYADNKLLFVYGFFMILGHSFPFYNKFRGGRGIFTFAGYIAFFAPLPMLIVGSLATLISLVFAQHRAAKYLTVGGPVIASLIISTITHTASDLTTAILLASISMIIVNFIVSKKRKEK
ncbi:MAG: hypothetical protein B6226_03665 [Candidatus Cloacimonetes bacterium 4572_65]|nr:MAG: hypothetical protein B6226_03665 [Candidatus Cloacimonetes bacterium 4572_65]